MAKELDDRYGSATEFADDLRRFLDGRPILARRPDAPTRAARWARRHKVAVGIATTVLALFVLGTAIGVGLLWREQVRTRENLRVALIALDEFCLSTTGLELTRDPERTQEVQNLQLKALTIYERMLQPEPRRPRDAMGRRPCRAPSRQHPGPIPKVRRGRAGFSSGPPEPDTPAQRDTRNVLEYRQEAADILADWGAAKLAGGDEVKKLRRRALDEHLRLASDFPDEPKHSRSVSRDCLEVAKSIGIIDPAEAVEKEALFRRAVALRKAAGGSLVRGQELSWPRLWPTWAICSTRRTVAGKVRR